MALALRNALLAALLTAAIVGTSVSAMYLTTASAWVNYVFEPFSLLLLPGLIFALVQAGPHDFSPNAVVYSASVFYFLAIFSYLWWRTRHPIGRTAEGSR